MANTQESALHYPLGDTLPAGGTTIEVAPGVRWLRMQLPFALDHINLWLLRDRLNGRDGWSAVDCGIANDATRANWEQIFANGLQGLPLLRVIVTHMHPDHVGLASWLTERWSTPEFECRLWMSNGDWSAARLASQSNAGPGGENAAPFFALHGLVRAQNRDSEGERANQYSSLVPSVPQRYRRLINGMRLTIAGRDWFCIEGHGHAPEHIALHCPELRVLISGDMVLPRISTNVSVFAQEPEGDPLQLYLSSIQRFSVLPPTTLVLPSHGKPFTGLHTRIAQLVQHHDERFADVLQACAAAPQSAADLLPVLFRRTLDPHQMSFAMGESIAHVNALQTKGQLLGVKDADGVMRFRVTA